MGKDGELTATSLTWLARWSTNSLTGGLASPQVEELSSLAVRWRFTVNRRCPDGVSHNATIGFRDESHASLVGLTRPGLKLREKIPGQRLSYKMTFNSNALEASISINSGYLHCI